MPCLHLLLLEPSCDCMLTEGSQIAMLINIFMVSLEFALLLDESF